MLSPSTSLAWMVWMTPVLFSATLTEAALVNSGAADSRLMIMLSEVEHEAVPAALSLHRWTLISRPL